ncbi:MAG TPA: shikimate kinase [Gemmatimonadota bacterium]|nr:shikimate kinase [Gemmatimonadota bacterium]
MGQARLYLAGLSGTGKTTAAELVARWLGCPWADVDREVERATGRSVAEIWAAEGEAAFRERERAAVERLTGRDGPRILALGGGTLEDPVSRERLAGWGTGVHLDGRVETLAERIADQPGIRPILAGGEPVAVLGALAVRRAATFAGLPHRIEIEGRRVEAVAVEVLRRIGGNEPREVAPRVWVGRGLLAHAGRLLGDLLPAAPRGTVVVATDRRVWDLHGDALAAGLEAAGWTAEPCPLAAGEAAKSTAGLERIWRAFRDRDADRDTPALVLGGGAAGDVGGMAAATFKRGLPLALFPTTLLAQVDAAIGGKNAIDLDGLKNVVGSFHPPLLVGADLLCLLTLPEREWRSGWAEIVKAGLIGDPDLFELCEREAAALLDRRLDAVEGAVERAVRVKVRIVEEDPLEAGRRRVLNLGHTLGHAIEAAGRGRWTHGEAIAMGLVAEARMGERMGITDAGLAGRIERVLAGLGLPAGPDADLDQAGLLDALRHDKKRAGGKLHVPLLVRAGEVRIAELDEAELGAALP